VWRRGEGFVGKVWLVGFATGDVCSHNGESGPQVTLRVLVDQSGYDLLNLGDVAMLQACVQRLRDLRPDASIAVLCHDADLLAKYCPGVIPVPAGRRRVPRSGPVRRIAVVAAQGWKIVGPYALPRRRAVDAAAPTGWAQAIRWADVVVSSGGGFITDAWWWHGAGVLSVLSAAQRLGKPTAMFGQGLGPLHNRLIRRQAARVLPRLVVLGLRGGATGEPLARELGVPSAVLAVTGDDGLEIVDLGPAVTAGDAVGVNVRVATYSGVDADSADRVGVEINRFVTEKQTAALVLPVSLFAGSSDAAVTERMLGEVSTSSVTPVDVVSDPADLVAAVARCRIVVTGSYHAAVFALARGVPVVGLSGSDYYDAKFADLAGMFPGAVWRVRLDGVQAAQQLSLAMTEAWAATPAQREQTRARAREQKAAGRAVYALFLERAAQIRD
jgi:colanic acid/amylovoran biosynthesis protein